MPDDEKSGNVQDESNHPPTTGSFPLRPAGEVVVTHLDAPPPAGKKNIHPRRVAPVVPTREEREVQKAPPSDRPQE